MIKEFLKRRKEKKAIREWQESEIGKSLSAHTREYFNDIPKLASFDDEKKQKIISDFYGVVANIFASENSFLEMREALSSYVVEYARYRALCLNEADKEESFLSGCQYISGELYKHIDKIVGYNHELGELRWKWPDISSEELVAFCNTRSLVVLYYLNGINYVRVELGDVDKEKDWLRPFMKSMLIWEEDNIRVKIGLPSLMPDSLDGLKHSTFMNMVTNGHKNPFYEWEKNWSSSGEMNI